MSVQALFAGAVTPGVRYATEQLDTKLVAAIQEALEGGVPYGIVVALLQGHLFQTTKDMLEER